MSNRRGTGTIPKTMKREFEVSIRLVQSATVSVEAEDWEEAEEIVRDRFARGDYDEELRDSTEGYDMPEITCCWEEDD